jgi:hypothetical protein
MRLSFTGELAKLTLTSDRQQWSPADIQKLQAAQQGSNKASE